MPKWMCEDRVKLKNNKKKKEDSLIRIINKQDQLKWRLHTYFKPDKVPLSPVYLG